MSNQFEEGWYPECRVCGVGNLGDNVVCNDCYNKLLEQLGIKKKVRWSWRNRNHMKKEG